MGFASHTSHVLLVRRISSSDACVGRETSSSGDVANETDVDVDLEIDENPYTGLKTREKLFKVVQERYLTELTRCSSVRTFADRVIDSNTAALKLAISHGRTSFPCILE
jgi:hypothetical protein